MELLKMNSLFNKAGLFVLLLSLINGPVLSAEEMIPGQVIGRHIFGLAKDANNDPLMIEDSPLIYERVSFQQRLQAGASTFDVSGFAHDLGGLYLTRYDADSKRHVDTVSMDIQSVEGLSRPTGGILSPWQTLLFSEAQIADAARPDAFINSFKPYYKGNADMINPYHYGWVNEVILLDDSGQSKLIKNYAVGRVSATHLYLMPDGRSLYLHDADHSHTLYLFVAEEQSNFAKGTLYALNLDTERPDYLRLGSESVLRMKFNLRRMKFDDLFERSDADTESQDRCARGFTLISTHYGLECLKIKKRNENAAGLFEPTRTLALKLNERPASWITNVRFDPENRTVSLQEKDKPVKAYRLAQDDKTGSSYAINEVLK
jgi:hypothetical protein